MATGARIDSKARNPLQMSHSLVSDNGSVWVLASLQVYLVHISVCAASYPLNQLEILLRVPSGQVDTGAHHFHGRLRRRSRTCVEPQQCTKTDILRKTYSVRKSQPESTVALTWLPNAAHAYWSSWRTLSMEPEKGAAGFQHVYCGVRHK